ncbi:histidinol-phosphate transaminase [Thermosulfurimonas marina]|uniref:Histidinol-phosphate aminotransferase n=1 Tax=Thermosulfurimonas marina TaxID=2047767 RepID=A0A6H1WUM5_9BACT|nr:histidinol-phosphate transaminase [Thermosulfurimonas marina]QJA06888.1 histidinol-phosphate transaminase [Thermosulfurimonas marina]
MEIKPWLRELSPYPPGKSLEEVRRELGLTGPIYKLASNENPLGPSPRALAALKEALSRVHQYPEASYRRLREALAARFGVLPEMVVLGNGSNEVLDLLFKALVSPGDEVLMSEPSFLMYEKLAQTAGARITRIPLHKGRHHLAAFLKASGPRTRMIFLDHPHNPTGSVLAASELKAFLEELPSGVLVVIDEAYGEFVRDPEAARGVEFLQAGYPVAVLRTFSKAYGLAGLRIGYGLMPEELARVLNAIRQPFNVNLLAAVAAEAALADEEHLQRTQELTWEGRDFLLRELSALGLKPYPSQANFVLVDCGRPARPLYEALLKRGLIVRPMEAYGFPEALRISVGLPEENQALVAALREMLEKA